MSKRSAPGPLPRPESRAGLLEQLSARGRGEKGLREGRDRWLGPAAPGTGRRERAPAPTSRREDLTLPRPRDFRSSIMDPGEFLLGLKGITQIAETWLSGSGRSPTSNRNRNFSQTKFPGFYGKAYLRARDRVFTGAAAVVAPARRSRIAWFGSGTRCVWRLAEVCVEHFQAQSCPGRCPRGHGVPPTPTHSFRAAHGGGLVPHCPTFRTQRPWAQTWKFPSWEGSCCLRGVVKNPAPTRTPAPGWGFIRALSTWDQDT